MLVLTRTIGERLTITCPDGTTIIVAIQTADRGACRLAIEAPKSYGILREDAISRNPKGGAR